MIRLGHVLLESISWGVSASKARSLHDSQEAVLWLS
jgi:hypothetical protein